MTLSLNEAAKEALDNGDEKLAGVYAQFAERSDIANVLRIQGISGNAVSWNLEGELPEAGFRAVGQQWDDSEGNFDPQKAALTILGGQYSVDRFLIKTMGEEAAVQDQVTLKVKAMAQVFTATVLNGSTTADPLSFDGLQSIVVEDGQLIPNGSTSGGDALSLNNLDEAIDAVAGATHIIMSRTVRRKFISAQRDNTFPNLRIGTDQLGKPVLMYNDLPILVGYGPGKNTPILPFAEANPGGGSAVGTSIYVVNFDDDGVVGFTNGGIMYDEIRENPTKPISTLRIEWYIGLMRKSQFAAARLWGIKDAAIVH